MGKRFKKRFRGLRCWNAFSSDKETKHAGIVSKEEDAPAKSEKTNRKPCVEEDVLNKESEEAIKRINSLMESLEGHRIKLKMAEHRHLEMISGYLVRKLELNRCYTQGSMSFTRRSNLMNVAGVNKDVIVGNNDLEDVECLQDRQECTIMKNKEEEEKGSCNGCGNLLLDGVRSYIPSNIILATVDDGMHIEGNTRIDINVESKFGCKNEIVPAQIQAISVLPEPLRIFCRRLFYDLMADSTTECIYEKGTQLAAHYTNVVRWNVSRSFDRQVFSEVTRSLKKLCFALFASPKDGKYEHASNQQKDSDLQLATMGVARSDASQCLRGGFGDVIITKNELTRISIEQWGRKAMNVKGGFMIMEPLPDMRCVLHQHILTVPSSQIRICLKDLIRRFEFNETHARFLCINLLKGLRHLHRLNIVHGRMTPRHVIFTEDGYPCLTIFERTHGLRPAVPPRVEYSSPEEITGEPIIAETDVFQTGLLVYLLLYVRSPYKADTFQQTRHNLLDTNFTPGFEPGTLSKDGRYFIRKLLKTEPGFRFKLDKCRKPLEKVVQWFKPYEGEEFSNQIYPSPFKESLLADGFGD